MMTLKGKLDQLFIHVCLCILLQGTRQGWRRMLSKLPQNFQDFFFDSIGKKRLNKKKACKWTNHFLQNCTLTISKKRKKNNVLICLHLPNLQQKCSDFMNVMKYLVQSKQLNKMQ